jgi:hypothetical protein
MVMIEVDSEMATMVAEMVVVMTTTEDQEVFHPLTLVKAFAMAVMVEVTMIEMETHMSERILTMITEMAIKTISTIKVTTTIAEMVLSLQIQAEDGFPA